MAAIIHNLERFIISLFTLQILHAKLQLFFGKQQKVIHK